MPQTANYANVKVRRQGHVVIVTFNRPAKANALDHAHLADIEAAALAFREDVDTYQHYMVLLYRSSTM